MKNSAKLLIAACLLLVTSPIFAKPVEVIDTVKIDYVKKKYSIKFYQEGERLKNYRVIKFLDQQDVCNDNMKLYHKHDIACRIMCVIGIFTLAGELIMLIPELIQMKKSMIALAAATDDFNNTLVPVESEDESVLQDLSPGMFK
jgi:hypothetical protein